MRDKAHEAVERNVAKPLGLSLEEAASGILAVANANMIQAIRTLSVERGHDVRGFSLLAFGGAGPVYAAYMARELGMAEVIAPRHPGVFAASGLLLTDMRHAAQAAWQAPLAGVTAKDIGTRLQALRDELDHELAHDGVTADQRYFRFKADMRCVGQFHRLSIPLTAPPGNGGGGGTPRSSPPISTPPTTRPMAMPTPPCRWSSSISAPTGSAACPSRPRRRSPPKSPQDPSRSPAATFTSIARTAGSTPRSTGATSCRRGQVMPGPAIADQRDSTILVLPDQEGRVDPSGVIRVSSKRR